MMPDTKYRLITKINLFLMDLQEMDQTRTACIMINEFEEQCPEERGTIQFMRDYLCDRTFEIYKEKYPIGTC